MRPDILITADGRSPVVIEVEFQPAANAESEARSRLGLEVEAVRRPIETVIALRYPDAIGDADDLEAALSVASLSYCVLTVGARNRPHARFPSSGWLDGSVDDLADLIRLVSVSQRAVVSAAAAMEEGIDRAAAILTEVDKSRPAITVAIARLLGMTNVPQTRRMACAILANAMVFHERLAGMHEGVNPLGLVCGRSVANPQAEMLRSWDGILRINYWPIFAIGRDILERLPTAYAARILRDMHYTAGAVNAAGIDNAHDLTGRVFQRLIADRKYLATFYTLPASAALLARLAVSKMKGVDWSDPDALSKLRIGDFACGTGALLSAVYEQIAGRHERSGGSPERLHPVMMEQVLWGCDVMPSAIHITGSTLSGAYPNVEFNGSRLYTLPYGRQRDGTVAIGSLDLLQTSAVSPLFNTSDPALRTNRIGEETAAYVMSG